MTVIIGGCQTVNRIEHQWIDIRGSAHFIRCNFFQRKPGYLPFQNLNSFTNFQMNQAQVYSRPQLYIFLVKLSSKESSTVDPHIVCNFGYMRLLFSNSNHNRSVKKPSIVQGLAIQTPTLFYLLVQIAQTFHDVTNAKSYIFTHTHPPLEILFIIDFTLQMQLLKELTLD